MVYSTCFSSFWIIFGAADGSFHSFNMPQVPARKTRKQRWLTVFIAMFLVITQPRKIYLCYRASCLIAQETVTPPCSTLTTWCSEDFRHQEPFPKSRADSRLERKQVNFEQQMSNINSDEDSSNTLNIFGYYRRR